MAGRPKKKNPPARRPTSPPRPSRGPQLYPYQQAWVDDESRFKLACKARQIGFTFAATLRVVLRRAHRPGLTLWISASERQALEALEQVRRHVAALGEVVTFRPSVSAGPFANQYRVSFPNGSRILALPANPDTVRGYAGDVVLDEFAFHRDAEAIWRAAFATITRGYQLEVISTPNGARGRFYELARQAGLVGAEPELAASGGAGPREPSVWSVHWCDVHRARALGFPVDIAALAAASSDVETWQQEYCCRFLSDAAAYLPTELLVAAEAPPDPAASLAPPTAGLAVGPAYLGVDLGRLRDKTVFWLLEDVGGVYVTREVRTLERVPFSAQRAALVERLSAGAPAGAGCRVARCAIDATGIGAMLAEELAARFGGRVEPVTFTRAIKEELAVGLKRLLEERRLVIPYDPALRRALAAVKRYLTPAGQVRFDAARTEEGHADEFWALALACRAATHAPLSTEFISSQIPHAFSYAQIF